MAQNMELQTGRFSVASDNVRVIGELTRELQGVLYDYNQRASAIMDEKELIALRLEQNKVLAEVVRKQNRHLRLMAGEQIEPETHYGEAVLTGVAFGGM